MNLLPARRDPLGKTLQLRLDVLPSNSILQ